MFSPSEVEKFRKNGYVLLPNFLSDDETNALTEECTKLVEQFDPTEHKSVFETGILSTHLEDDYFLNSGDKIRFFLEADSLDNQGNLKYGKQQCINKIGHALHWLNDAFKKVTFSDKVKDIARSLDFLNPVIIHSMIILKPSKTGGKVEPHQDETYLYCEPNNKVVGLWIPLEDATLENGCLCFIPESHNDPVSRRLIRTQTKEGHKLVYTGSPVTYDTSEFIPVPAKKGDLILIDGRVVHMSERNTSDHSRLVYTFHIFDNNGAKFSELNWIQPSKDVPFTPLFN